MIKERYNKTRKEIRRDRVIEYGMMLLSLPYHIVMIGCIVVVLMALFK